MLLNVLPKVSKDICKPSQNITIWSSNIMFFFGHGQIVLYRLNCNDGECQNGAVANGPICYCYKDIKCCERWKCS
jgi:hypothetical protein